MKLFFVKYLIFVMNKNLKKIYTLLLLSLFLICFNAIKADNNKPLVTEMIINKGDSVFRNLFLYNNANLNTLETVYYNQNETWLRESQKECFYDESGRNLEHVFRKWNGERWVDYYYIEFNYENLPKEEITHFDVENKNRIPKSRYTLQKTGAKKILEQNFIWENGSWIKTQEINFQYKVDKLSQIEIKFFNNNQMTEQQKIQYVYDNDELMEIVVQEKMGDDWLNTLRVQNFYEDFSNLKQMEIVANWNDIYSFWENSQKIEYEYDDNNKLKTERFSNWSSKSFWSNILEYQYDYNDSGALIEKRHYAPIHRDFRLISTVEYKDFEYEKASLIEANNEFWSDFEANTPLTTIIPYQFNDKQKTIQANRIFISYIPVDPTIVTENSTNNNLLIKVYPNPSDGIFYFDTNSMNDAQSWRVLDLSGKELLSKKIENRSGVIDLGDYQSGIYLFQVITDSGVKSQKLIKK